MNIDQVLLAAHSASDGWTVERAEKLGLAMRAPGVTIDWDASAGEAWIRVLRASRVLAYLSVNIPIAISIVNTFHSDNVQNIGVEALGEPVFSATRSALVECFGDSARLDGLDLRSFSADDLWYATV